jgi:hypothetical protein
VAVQVLLLSIIVPLIALSAYTWATGRGAMLIAGFNTAPKAVKDLYDSRPRQVRWHVDNGILCDSSPGD